MKTTPPTVTISASPASITAGATSTLTVTAANASSVTISGSDGTSYTLTATGGTQNVTPGTTTTYTATATGTGGSVTAMAVVTVTGKPAPTVTIAASPATIAAGSASTLTVVATNSTTVTISGTDGSLYSLAAAGGTQAVNPSATTTYTATAVGGGGNITATAAVTVTPNPAAPTVTLSASPAGVSPGTPSTLTVAATNATTVTITGSDGSSYTLAATGGTQSVTPSATTVYMATATGTGGTVTAFATVTVASGAPNVTISANPSSITPAQSSILTVVATNATSPVTVTGSDGSSYTLTVTGGIQAVSPTATTIYTATAVGAGSVMVTATATVTVSANPAPSVTITASPSSIADGGTSNLAVTAANAASVIITGTDGSSYALPAAGGSQAVTPGTTTTYTATAMGAGGTATAKATVTVTANPAPEVTISASPTSIVTGNSSTLTVTASYATAVSIAGSDGSSYPLAAVSTPQTQTVTPTVTVTTTPVTVTYTVTATGEPGTTPATAATTLTVTPAGSLQSINHVIFLMQENHSFDNYLGMLNPYRKNPSGTGTCPNNAQGVPQCYNVGDDGNTYNVDGIDDKLTTISDTSDANPPNSEPASVTFNLFKLTSTCIDDDSSAWLSSFGDVNRYDNDVNRPIQMNGFVHTAQGYANSCNASGNCVGDVGDVFTDTLGARAMGYYDQTYLNYYYYMASQFALSDRWFSPVASKTIDNRIATMSGGTTQGLVQDPTLDDHLDTQLNIETIFRELENANVSWKIYYSVTDGDCKALDDECVVNGKSGPALQYPDAVFESFEDSYNYLRENPTESLTYCATLPPVGTLQPSSVVGDTSNSFCINPTHIAPISQFYTDLTNNTLPSFAWIEPGYGLDDEHPGSGQPITQGENQVQSLFNAFMTSPSYADSVFFLAFDEGGGPYDHVPPVPGHSNDFTNISNMGYLGPSGTIPDIGSIAVNPDTSSKYPTMYFPCLPPTTSPWTATTHCDLQEGWAGSVAGDVVSEQGFAAQIGFRVPNMVISPFVRRHYVSHTPMDHTAILKFVENRFIGPNAHLTNRDAAQPDLLDFFDFTNIPWATPPTPPLAFTNPSKSLCTPAMAPMNGVAP
ncbi:MAG: alkaline phosphatase family protein [Terracidiphilus sp.]